MPVAEATAGRVFEETVSTTTGPPRTSTNGQGNCHVAFAFVAHRAVVDVDPELGLVRVVQMATAQDVGRALNPLSVIGQIEGGIAQGLGLAVMEEIVIEDGRIRNPSFTDYLLPTALDAPEVVVSLVEEPDPQAPLGREGRGRAAVHRGDAGDRRRHPRRHRAGPGPGAGSPSGHLPRLGSAHEPDERERLSWASFGDGSRTLARMVHNDGFEPDIILAIARGGLLVAAALGYALSVKNLYTMNVEYYTGIDERLDVPMILPPTPELVDLADADVLVADDVADTGHTLAAVKDFCIGKVAEVRAPCSTRSPGRS